MRKFVPVAILLVSISSISWGQQDEIPQKFTIDAGYGTVTMGDVQWQRFSFRPDIPIGPVGVGLDLELFIDENGKISDEAWDFSNNSRAWDSIVRKIYYIRYGKPEDKVFVRVGALDDVTLGYGIIMDGYRNTLRYPGDKKTGLNLSVRDIGTFGIGIEGMINSFGDIKNKGLVVGGRVSFRPLKPTNTGLLGKLTFGLTFVRDINQYAGLDDSDDDGVPDFQDGFPDDDKLWLDTDRDGLTDFRVSNGDTTFIDPDADGDNLTDAWWSDDQGHSGFDNDVTHADPLNIKDDVDGVSVYGFDAGLPLMEGPVRLDLYGQYAGIHTGRDNFDGGWGIGAPGLRLLFNRFKGQIEYRHFEGRFRHNYFDHLYEQERAVIFNGTVVTREEQLIDQTLDGIFGRAGYNFFDIARAEASYQYMTGDDSYQDLTGRASVGTRVLERIPRISILETYYYNTFVNTSMYDLLDNTQNTMYGTRIGIEIVPSLIMVWDTRYTFTPNGRGGFDKQRFVSIETVISLR